MALNLSGSRCPGVSDGDFWGQRMVVGVLTPEGKIFGYDFNTVLYAVLYSWGCMLDVFCLCAPAKN